MICLYTLHHVEKGMAAYLVIYDEWLDLASVKCLTSLFNGAGAAHSLGRVKHEATTFQLKIKKYNMKNTKMSSWSS